MPPKSILKKPSSTSSSNDDALKKRHLATALHHANLIQHQKDIEKLIVNSVLELLDLPSSPDADPARPAETDAAKFKQLVSIFQPNDYVEFIEERVASKLCGYALCPRPPLTNGDAGTHKIIITREHGLKVVPRSRVERWCSDECAKRALYIQVQLEEELASVRRADAGARIELYKESQQAEESPHSLQYGVNTATKADVTDDAAKHMEALALESNQSPVGEPVGNKLIKADIIEKHVRTNPVAPSFADGISLHKKIEGHDPQDLASIKEPVKDEEDKDWDV